jgi:hypothetical protein
LSPCLLFGLYTVCQLPSTVHLVSSHAYLFHYDANRSVWAAVRWCSNSSCSISRIVVHACWDLWLLAC